MKLYEVSDSYVDYLKQFDSKIMNNTKNNRRRKYLGVVIKVSHYKYLIPLSSAKEGKDYEVIGKNRNGYPIHKLLSKPVTIPIIFITDKVDDTNIAVLAKLQLNNMFPVYDEVIKEYDIYNENDAKYKYLINKEINFLRINKKVITRNANIIYTQKIQNMNQIGYIKKATVDFLLLEAKCKDHQEKNSNLLSIDTNIKQEQRNKEKEPILTK